MKPRERFAIVVLAALGLSVAGGSPSASAQQQAAQPPMNAFERLLEDRIYVQLAERAWVGADFDARVNQGVVTLSGTVPTEQTKQGILRIVRGTFGVSQVNDRLRVDPAVSRLRGGSPVPDEDLARRVAQKIAASVDGARAGEDWWFTGWRVEGPYQAWTMVVEALDGAVTLDGEVSYSSTLREAVKAALEVPGVLSVRSEVELEGLLYGNPAFYWWHPYGLAHHHDPDYFLVVNTDSASGDVEGSSTLTGAVTQIDKLKGTLTLKTDAGSFDLKLPPASLQAISTGQTITVEMGLRGTDPSASPADGTPAGREKSGTKK